MFACLFDLCGKDLRECENLLPTNDQQSSIWCRFPPARSSLLAPDQDKPEKVLRVLLRTHKFHKVLAKNGILQPVV